MAARGVAERTQAALGRGPHSVGIELERALQAKLLAQLAQLFGADRRVTHEESAYPTTRNGAGEGFTESYIWQTS